MSAPFRKGLLTLLKPLSRRYAMAEILFLCALPCESLGDLGFRTGMGYRAARRVAARLVADGLIRLRKGGWTSDYELTPAGEALFMPPVKTAN